MAFQKYPRGMNELVAFGRSVLAYSKRALTIYLLPISATWDVCSESKRKKEALIAELSVCKLSTINLHRPSSVNVFWYSLHETYWMIMRFCLFWMAVQMLFGAWPLGTLRLLEYMKFGHRFETAALWVLLVLDFALVGCSWLLLLASVSSYGPSNVCYVLSFKYDRRVGVTYRRALQSLPLASDIDGRQAEKWEFTRSYLKELARIESQRRLGQAVLAFLVSIVSLSCISLILSTASFGVPVIGYGAHGTDASGGIAQHAYFFFITFATIGYGDISFLNHPRGHVAGLICALLVMLTGYGLVSYLNYYVVNFKERLLSGLDGAVGGNLTPTWLWQSLKDV